MRMELNITSKVAIIIITIISIIIVMVFYDLLHLYIQEHELYSSLALANLADFMFIPIQIVNRNYVERVLVEGCQSA